jgi:5-methylthioadenosine/S-adenosylhomocysteine deaminase
MGEMKLITSHDASLFSQSNIQKGIGLLDRDFLFSHANKITSEEMDLLKDHGGYISFTPSTEFIIGSGLPVAAHPDLHERSSLGVDGHSTASVDLFGQVCILLAGVRNEHLKTVNDGIGLAVEEAFNMCTIGGARVVGMGDKIGEKVGGCCGD